MLPKDSGSSVHTAICVGGSYKNHRTTPYLGAFCVHRRRTQRDTSPRAVLVGQTCISLVTWPESIRLCPAIPQDRRWKALMRRILPLKQNEWYLEPAYPGVVCKDYPGDVVKVGLRGNNLLLESV